METLKQLEECPNCQSGNLTVYWLNGKSYCDYCCRDCGEAFGYSKVKKKIYKLPLERKQKLQSMTFEI